MRMRDQLEAWVTSGGSNKARSGEMAKYHKCTVCNKETAYVLDGVKRCVECGAASVSKGAQ